jgi:hypothetical protein
VAIICSTSVIWRNSSAWCGWWPSARTPAGLSDRLDTAYAALIDGLTAELADWIGAWGPTLENKHRTVLAALGVNGILGARFATGLFREPALHIPDDQYLNEWTAVLAARIETQQK